MCQSVQLGYRKDHWIDIMEGWLKIPMLGMFKGQRLVRWARVLFPLPLRRSEKASMQCETVMEAS